MYNWESCSDPANVERLKELIEAGREVIIQTIPGHVYSSKTSPAYWLDKLADGGRDKWQFLDPNPWRYPSRGELPGQPGRYLVTRREVAISDSFLTWTETRHSLWDGDCFDLVGVFAWRESDPAPVIEEEQ